LNVDIKCSVPSSVTESARLEDCDLIECVDLTTSLLTEAPDPFREPALGFGGAENNEGKVYCSWYRQAFNPSIGPLLTPGNEENDDPVQPLSHYFSHLTWHLPLQPPLSLPYSSFPYFSTICILQPVKRQNSGTLYVTSSKDMSTSGDISIGGNTADDYRGSQKPTPGCSTCHNRLNGDRRQIIMVDSYLYCQTAAVSGYTYNQK